MKIFITTFLLLISCSTSAESMFGYGLSYGAYEIHDPSGPTTSREEETIYRFSYMNKMKRDKRWYIEYNQNEIEANASMSDIGQTAYTKNIQFSYQQNFPITRGIKPWLGAGLNLSNK